METIRPAETQDVQAVSRLLQHVLQVHHRARPDLFRPCGQKYSAEELIQIFSDPDRPVFVYDRDGDVLGYAFCMLLRQGSGCLQELTTLYVDDLCVDPKARRQHIGQALFSHIKAFARERGCHNITLHAWEGNPAARAFYDRLGLTPQYTCLEIRP